MRAKCCPLVLLIFASIASAQTTKLEIREPVPEVSKYVMERLNAKDRALFEKLSRVSIEALWSEVVATGFQQCFINELDPLHPDRRMIGRARTIRYLPNRPDLREEIYSKQKQLNYVSAEEAQPGDVLVFEAGGEIRSSVSGDVVTTKAVYNGASGVVVDGAMRDVPELSRLPIQAYMRRGNPQTVSPIMMSVDYQVPVRITGVTVRPGDILLGDRHGVLVIPAAIADKAVDRALEKDGLENFQRSLILQGESLYDVYPANDKVRQRYEEFKKNRQ
jgi:regulator of RNase E activity RraA